jgi:hypothetical protein
MLVRVYLVLGTETEEEEATGDEEADEAAGEEKWLISALIR